MRIYEQDNRLNGKTDYLNVKLYPIVQCDVIRQNSFCGYVVLDSVNMKSRDENSILYQIYIYLWKAIIMVGSLFLISLKCLNFHDKNLNIFAFHIFWSKMLSSFLNAMLTLSKTTSPHKLFRSDCISFRTTGSRRVL